MKKELNILRKWIIYRELCDKSARAEISIQGIATKISLEEYFNENYINADVILDLINEKEKQFYSQRKEIDNLKKEIRNLKK